MDAKLICHEAREGDTVLLKASRGEKLERVFEEWKRMQAFDASSAKGVEC